MERFVTVEVSFSRPIELSMAWHLDHSNIGSIIPARALIVFVLPGEKWYRNGVSWIMCREEPFADLRKFLFAVYYAQKV